MRKAFALTVFVLAACSDLGTGPDEENKLSAARALWESSGADHYRFRLDYGCFCGIHPHAAIIEVRDEEIVSVLDATSGNPPQQTHGMRTITDLFDQIGYALSSDRAKVSVTYDVEKGYPRSAHIDYLPNAIDDEATFGVQDVVILD